MNRHILARRAYARQQLRMAKANPSVPRAYMPCECWGGRRRVDISIRDVVWAITWLAMAATGVIIGLILTGGTV